MTLSGSKDNVHKPSSENLASFCNQDYPRYEIIFGICDESDASVHIIRKLARSYPGISIKMAFSKVSTGANPKINNLMAAFNQASFDLLVISDANVCVGPDYLSAVVAPLVDEKKGVVTCLYKSKAGSALAAFEALPNLTGCSEYSIKY